MLEHTGTISYIVIAQGQAPIYGSKSPESESVARVQGRFTLP